VLYLEDAQPKEVIDTSIEFLTSVICASGHEIQLDEKRATAEKLLG
jgi:hypothetical protein